MIKINDKSKCNGCGACIVACPTNAIDYYEDEDGVKYPHVNESLCIRCNKCNSVCSEQLHNAESIRNISYKEKYYAAQLIDKSELMNVSSGGAFWALGKRTIELNGVVYGAVQENIEEVRHIRATSLDELNKMRRSKYLQSDCVEAFKSVKNDLIHGKTILFSGTGCQIAALKMLYGENENLITSEVVCHGVPCGIAWKSYIKELALINNSSIKEVIFRDKSKGWSNNQYKIEFNNNNVDYESSLENIFHSRYLQGLMYRPSCGKCVFARIPRVADITLADFWQYKGKMNENGDIGISLVIINSEKGFNLFNEASKYIEMEETDKEAAVNSCRHLTNSPYEDPRRAAFIMDIKKMGYLNASKDY